MFIRTHCPHCHKALTPGEMIDRWCERCTREINTKAETAPAKQDAATPRTGRAA